MSFDKREDGYNISESGNWNVAADYSRLKIMKPLYLCDSYENIARFGHDELIDELANFNIPNDVLRLNGFNRLVYELLRLIDNTKFVLRKKGSKEEAEKLEKELRQVLKIIPTLSRTIKTRKGSFVKINDENFIPVLKKVSEIKSKLNVPLNQNDLIFTHKEDFDPQAYKKKIMEDAMRRG
ncbi:MAG: hypothetical protein ACFFC1_13785 [Promethearchaeota archaeon]